MIKKTGLLTASLIAAMAVFAATGAQAQHAPGYVKMMHVTMQDGSAMDLEVVDVNGHMMVLVPEDKVYDALHQTPFKKTP